MVSGALRQPAVSAALLGGAAAPTGRLLSHGLSVVPKGECGEAVRRRGRAVRRRGRGRVHLHTDSRPLRPSGAQLIKRAHDDEDPATP